jgi:hypothetical protein
MEYTYFTYVNGKYIGSVLGHFSETDRTNDIVHQILDETGHPVLTLCTPYKTEIDKTYSDNRHVNLYIEAV